MPTDYNPYIFLAVFFGVAFAFPLIPLLLARIWAETISPQKTSQTKNATYECGLEAKGDGRIRYKSSYYLYAIIFLVFDVEAIFLLPFAVSFSSLPFGAFAATMVFVLLLVEGLAWAWVKGILTWD